MSSWIAKRCAIAVIYCACAVFNAGAFLAEFHGRFPGMAKENYRRDLGAAWTFALSGPIGVPLTILFTGFLEHGWTAPWGHYREHQPRLDYKDNDLWSLCPFAFLQDPCETTAMPATNVAVRSGSDG